MLTSTMLLPTTSSNDEIHETLSQLKTSLIIIVCGLKIDERHQTSKALKYSM